MKLNKNKGMVGLLLLFVLCMNIISVYADCDISYTVNTEYKIVEVFERGTPFFYGNPFSETIIYAKERYWVITFDATGHIWVYNSTDKINWYGTEIESIKRVEGDGQVYITGFYSLYSVKDSQGDIHIAFEERAVTSVWYIKVITFADGSITDLGTVSISSDKRLYDLVVDGQDYPVVAVQSSANTAWLIGSTTKDGSWTQDYRVLIGEGMQWIRVSIHPMSCDNGKDFVITYVWEDIYTFYGADVELYLIAQYFDESAESFNGQRWVVDYGLNGYPFSSYTNTPSWEDWNRGNAPTIAFEDNITFATYYGEDEATGELALVAYKTENGGLTWSRYIVYNLTAVQTDMIGHMIRINEDKDVIVYYRHNDIHSGNFTFFYEAINYADVSGWANWSCEDVEIYNTNTCWDDQWEGAWAWSTVRGGETLGVIEKGFIFGVENNTEVKDYLYILDLELEEEGKEYPQPELLNVTIKGYDGDYLFEGEVYEIDSYWNNTHYCYFELNDSVNEWRYYYYNESKYMGINVIGFEGLKENEFIAGTIFTNYTYYNASGINQNVSRLQWRFILGVQVVDCFNRTLSYYGENYWYNSSFEGNKTQGDSGYTDINIYNLGGYVTYNFSGDAGHVIGGEAFELWAENATGVTYAYSEKIFRKLQHYNGLVELYTEMDWQEIFPHQWQIEDVIGAGYLEYGFDFRYNQTWYEGWKCRILIHSGNIGHHGGGQDTAWIKLNVKWYYNDSLVSEDYIYSYHYSYFPENGNQSTRLSFNFFVDLWFNQENSSKVVGGRITPFYLGVQERGWWGFGSFRPMYTDRVASSFATNLEVNNVSLSSKELEIIKCWCKLVKLSQDDKLWKLLPYTESHFKQASDRMMGVETPSYVEPKMPAIESQMGFLTGLKRSIENIANSIWMGTLGFIKVLWGAMDSLLSFMGFPEGTWSRITYFIMVIPNLLVTLINWIPIILDNMIALIGNMFGFLTITIGRYIWFLGHFATTWITWVKEIINFFTGGFGGISNLWELLDLEQWFMLFITIIFPMWWIERVWTSKNSLKQLQDDLKTFSGFYTGLFNFLKDMVILIRNLLGAIRSVLPI